MIDIDEIDLDKTPSVLLSDKKLLPEIRCVYFAVSNGGVVLYVGYTTNLRQRWATHHLLDNLKDEKVSIRWYENDNLSNEELYCVEQDYISLFEPQLNKVVGRSFVPRKKKVKISISLSEEAIEILDNRPESSYIDRSGIIEMLIRNTVRSNL